MAVVSLETQKLVVQVLKYLGLVIATIISIYSLIRDSLNKEQKRETRHRLLWLMSLAGLLTLGTAIWENVLDDRLNEKAKREGDEKANARLKESTDLVLDNMKTKFGQVL